MQTHEKVTLPVALVLDSLPSILIALCFTPPPCLLFLFWGLIDWNRRYRQLWASMWVLTVEAGSSRRVPSILNRWAVCPVLPFYLVARVWNLNVLQRLTCHLNPWMLGKWQELYTMGYRERSLGVCSGWGSWDYIPPLSFISCWVVHPLAHSCWGLTPSTEQWARIMNSNLYMVNQNELFLCASVFSHDSVPCVRHLYISTCYISMGKNLS